MFLLGSHALGSIFTPWFYCLTPSLSHTRLSFAFVGVVPLHLRLPWCFPPLHGLSKVTPDLYLTFAFDSPLNILTLLCFGMLTCLGMLMCTCLSSLFTLPTLLNLTKPYFLPFLFLVLAMNSSRTSPHFLNSYHNSFSLISPENLVK